MSVDWAIIGVVVAVAALIVSYLQLRLSKVHQPPSNLKKIPNKITYCYDETSSSIREHYEKSSLPILHVAIIKLVNENDYTIEDIKIRIGCAEEIWWSQVDSSKSISKSSVNVKKLKGSVVVEIPFMPAKERLVFSIASLGLHLQPEDVASESAHVELKRGSYRV
jgi:hypothetical protein